ncbi:MAG: hypothetical protein NC938_01795 [Candidatus Omnitrophica bacterium]|nr:hypothetical protein [Candidatus Omnitrophota bacterium]
MGIYVSLLKKMIPAILLIILAVFPLGATEADVDAQAENQCKAEDDSLRNTPRHKMTLRGTLTESQEEQLRSMQAELYRMREESWDDRYRYH